MEWRNIEMIKTNLPLHLEGERKHTIIFSGLFIKGNSKAKTH